MDHYRIFVDESGNDDMDPKNISFERYLTLVGLIIKYPEDYKELHIGMEKIKNGVFDPSSDLPVIFHRKDILKKKGAFSILFEDNAHQNFDDQIIELITRTPFLLIGVTIDKLEHKNRYHGWSYEPYYYCLKVLLERYVLFLKSRNSMGDVFIESRNPDKDKCIKGHFQNFYWNGTENVDKIHFQSRLTSSEINIREKKANINGLQLADLLAHPVQYDILFEYGKVATQEAIFGRRICEILRRGKYRRQWLTGELKGYGMKLLP
jgi:hypothetical protein